MKNLILILLFMPFLAFARIKANSQIITACSMASNCNSTGVEISQIEDVSIQAVWTGTAENGTFKVQGSNDLVNNPSLVTHWTDQTGSSQAISADGDFMWNVSLAPFRFIRLVYTASSGSGTLNANLSGKGWN